VRVQEDWQAHLALNAELEALRQDVGLTWLQVSQRAAPAALCILACSATEVVCNVHTVLRAGFGLMYWCRSRAMPATAQPQGAASQTHLPVALLGGC